jgi:NTE family protein
VDGAIGELDLLSHATAYGVTDIYLLPAGYPCAGTAPTTALGSVLAALSLLLHRQLLTQVRGYVGDAQLHVLPPLCPLSVSPADSARRPTSWLAPTQARAGGWARRIGEGQAHAHSMDTVSAAKV